MTITDLTEKQFKTRWIDIKKQIKERPLLAYRVGIPLEEWDKYMSSLPPKDEINRIYYAIQNDRKTKTLRIKKALSKIVGYREAKEFSKRIRVSDTSIRDILEGKKEMAGYDIINRLEIYLSVTLPDFEVSIENTLNIKYFTLDSMHEIVSDIDAVASNIKSYCFELLELVRKQEKKKDWQGNEIEPSRYIELCVKKLSEHAKQIDLYWDTYIDKK